MIQIDLHAGWQCKERNQTCALGDDLDSRDGWLAATVPGSVHQALHAAGQIPDPYSLAGQAASAWVCERDWLYRCHFDLADAAGQALLLAGAAAAPVELDFAGLDTVATVWLNGHLILHSDNMFVPARVEVAQLLKPDNNRLTILFESALRVGRQRQATGGQRPVWNGDSSRVYVRKAQYQYGWDFGPTLLGAGPWQPIKLRAQPARITDLRAPLVVAADLRSAELAVDLTVSASPAATLPLTVSLTVDAPDGSRLADWQQSVAAGRAPLSHTFSIAAPQLWWPHGHGAQPLYRLTVRLLDGDGATVDEQTLRLGARRLRLLQTALADGETFYFELNNQPLFCGGANWIPPDLLPHRVSDARYRLLLEQAVHSGLTMLRIWGGGIYESDCFYDLCDELGILVWQDFLFACGLYPSHPDFAASVAAEATAALRRLRHHPSLVIWAGNNEDYAIATSVAVYRGPGEPLPESGPSSLSQPRFDGRRLYEQLLAQLCAVHDPSRPYWPGSPYSRRSSDPNSQLEGDRHIWEVWHSPMLDYQDYGRLGGRFASEFGMQALPDQTALRRALGVEPSDIAQLAQLNKGQDGPARIGRYLDRNLAATTSPTVAEYSYRTQVIQAEALGYAVRSFRRGFDAERRMGGALVWQFNDCWPGISWSMLSFCDEDQPLRAKPSLAAVRRELLPFAVGLAATAATDTVDAWVVTPAAPAAELRLRLRAFATDGRLCGQREDLLHLPPNQASELGPLTVPLSPPDAALPLVYGAQLLVGDRVVARSVLWPQPLAKLALQPPGLRIDRQGDRVTLSVQRPTKALLVSTEPPLRLSDNLLDLLPDEPLTVEAPGLAGATVQLRSLAGVHPWD